MLRIKIIKPLSLVNQPQAEPEDVQRAWIGLVLPCASREKNGDGQAVGKYIVSAGLALGALRQAGQRGALDWYEDFANWVGVGSILISPDVCEPC